MSVDKLQEIKEIHNEFMYPTTNEFGIHEEDVDWLIKEIERLRTIEQAYNALRSAL